MAVKNFRQKFVAFVAGVLIGPAIVYAGLETGTYISDLVATNPLSSDLASTADDHIRLLKSTIKTTFPNINGAVNSSDEELNLVDGLSGTIWTSANDGAASTLDADLLDNISSAGFLQTSTYQALSPSWTATHVFGNTWSSGNPGALTVSANDALIELDDANAAANNRRWWIYGASETLAFQISNDARNSAANWLLVDRTGTTVDKVAFTTDNANNNFVIGTQASVNAGLVQLRTTQASRPAFAVASATALTSTVQVFNEATSGDNIFINFSTEAITGSSARGSIDYNRAGGAVRYNTTSDERLKKNFKQSPSARKVIDCIQVESYDWKETGYHVDHGFVAQRLNKCAPYAVKSSKDPSVIWGVDPSKLVPVLIKYVQEQDARIAELERAQSRH